MSDHLAWEQLAAGHALDALEPDEIQDLTAHVTSCAECRHVLDEHRAVAAHLAALAEPIDHEATAPSWGAMRAGILGTSNAAPAVDPGVVVSLRPRRRPRLLAVAAAVTLLAGVGVATWQIDQGGTTSPVTAAMAACRHDAGCRLAPLRTSSGSMVGVVLVRGDGVEFVRAGAGAGPGHELALWQLPRSGRPALLGEFGDVARSRTTLKLPLADTAGFALSREPAGTVVTQPSLVVATS